MDLCPLKPAEIDLFAEMVVALYAEDHGPVAMTRARAAAQAAQLLARPERAAPHLLREGGEVVGYAILAPFWSNEFGGEILVLDELWIRPELRSRGLGARALDAVVARARELGAWRVELQVNGANERAMALYLRRGFARLDRAILGVQVREP